MSRLTQLRRLLCHLEDALLVTLLSSMLLLATSQILFRNLWDSSIAWGDPTLRLLVLWLGLLGAMVATRENRHIRIDLIPQYLPDRLKRPVARLTDLFTAGVCGLLSWHGTRLVLIERADGMLFLDLFPFWLCEVIIPIGFGIIGLRFFISALTGSPQATPS